MAEYGLDNEEMLRLMEDRLLRILDTEHVKRGVKLGETKYRKAVNKQVC